MEHGEYFFRKVVPTVKRFVGISDLSLFRKRWSKRIGKILYHKKYNASQLVARMQSLGMRQGSVVCIHASMMQFFNYKGTAEDLISEILRVIGDEGTLLMPAFPKAPGIPYDDYIFDPATTKTAAGYLAESFRKYPGVIRSNNVHHSVCAIGKYADYLTRDHTKGSNCWDELSPWYKMCQLNALVFNLGLPNSYIGTFCHCVEGTLYKSHPYWSQFFTFSQKYNYIDDLGNVISYNQLEGRLLRKVREKNVSKYFTNEDCRVTHISNLKIVVHYSRNVLEKLLDLGRHGITLYYLPSPKRYKF